MARNPRINIVVSKRAFSALKNLSEQDVRSVSQYVSLLIERHILDEQIMREHGPESWPPEPGPPIPRTPPHKKSTSAKRTSRRKAKT